MQVIDIYNNIILGIIAIAFSYFALEVCDKNYEILFCGACSALSLLCIRGRTS